MKIGLDYISSFGVGGNATYTRGLIDGLSKIDKKNDYYLYTYLHKLLPFYKNEIIRQKNFHYQAGYFCWPYEFFQKKLRAFEQKLLFRRSKKDKIDIFHLTNSSRFNHYLEKFVVTIHDIAPFHSDRFAKKNSVLFYNKYFKQIINKARCIIVDAEFTKRDILSKFNIKARKIRVVPLATDDTFRPIYNLDILKKYRLEKKYILSVGELQPRKNLPALLKVYSLLPEKIKKEYDLILVGMPRNQFFLDKLKKIIIKQKIEKNVKILGYLNNKELSILYSHAYIFVYLSLLEGFGLPPLESLMCGRPVLVANNSTLPEVIGSAGIGVDPRNIEQIVVELKKLLENQFTIDDLIKNIPNQIKKFSWQKTAEQTLQIYEEFI